MSGSWRDGSVLKNAVCSCRGPGFNSQHADGSSQPSVTLVPGDLISFSGLLLHHVWKWRTDMDADKTSMHIRLRERKGWFRVAGELEIWKDESQASARQIRKWKAALTPTLPFTKQGSCPAPSLVSSIRVPVFPASPCSMGVAFPIFPSKGRTETK